jgi:predicted homoserine dehydrogenase-like protein
MTWAEARESNSMPLGLAERGTVLKPIKAGERITYDNCRPDETLLVTQIRRRLDQQDSQYAH